MNHVKQLAALFKNRLAGIADTNENLKRWKNLLAHNPLIRSNPSAFSSRSWTSDILLHPRNSNVNEFTPQLESRINTTISKVNPNFNQRFHPRMDDLIARLEKFKNKPRTVSARSSLCTADKLKKGEP